MNCKHCGNLISANAKFCTSCGAPVQDAPEAHRTPPPLPHPAVGAAQDDWSIFFQSLGSDLLNVVCLSPGRFGFEGERKVKALLSRTTLHYEALALLDPAAKLIQWWEKLSESSFGVAPENFGVTAESYRQKGASIEIQKTVQTPGGGYTYHYGDLRTVVEAEARRRGWNFKLLLARPTG